MSSSDSSSSIDQTMVDSPVKSEVVANTESKTAETNTTTTTTVAGVKTVDIPPNQTIYINNLNEKIKLVMIIIETNQTINS
jgi:hypothetical protein